MEELPPPISSSYFNGLYADALFIKTGKLTRVTNMGGGDGGVQLLSHIWLFVTPRTAALQASLPLSIYLL